MPASRPRPVPTTPTEGALLGAIDTHAADATNPHATKLAQLADLTNAVAGTAGMVPTKQADGSYLLTTPPGAAGGAPVGSATPLPPQTTGAVGVSASAAHEDHRHPYGLIQAAPRGYKALPVDLPIALYTATLTPTSGTIYVARLRVETAGTISNVTVPITTAGGTLTNCYVGVYDATSLAQLGVSTDQSASWASAGTKTVTLAAPTASQAAGTDLYVAFLYNGTSLALRGITSAPLINFGLTCFGSAGTAQTALPATLGTITSVTVPYFFAVT